MMKIERQRFLFDLTAWSTALLLSIAMFAVAAEAKSRNLTTGNATWRTECGSCHVAYPPALLPDAEWRQLMGSLDRHFGVDASIDAKAAAEISAFLAATAGRGKGRAADAQPRITITRWFRHEHGEISTALFRSASVNSAANCAACHSGAAIGDFNEHAVSIPR